MLAHASRLAFGALLLSVLGCGARTGLTPPGARDAGLDGAIGDAALPDADTRDAPFVDAPFIDCLDDPTRCDDGSACTVDDCLPDGSCAHVARACDDGDACTDDACDPSLGCTALSTDCDDHTVCTTDSCDHARGCAHAVISCDDADPCTANRCDPISGCTFPPTDCAGCADGSRDAFRDALRYPLIAACAGGFSVAGLSHAVSPTCSRGAGDDGPNPSGLGCSATDLCAPGWHICVSAAEVQMHSPDGCAGANDADRSSFFATRQTGPGCGHCANGTDPSCDGSSCRPGCAQTDRTTNDIFGCGDLGAIPQASSCGVLDRFSNDLCGALGAPWRCDADPAGLRESDFVVKPGATGGGVLCCVD